MDAKQDPRAATDAGTAGRDDRPAYDWSAFPRGALGAVSVPGLVMSASFVGFGALMRGFDFELGVGLFMTATIWALPGQVVMASMVVQGASLVAVAAAVTLTAVRLLPMVVLVLSEIRVPRAARWPLYVMAYFIAVTIWMISNQQVHALPRSKRLPWLLGLGCTLMTWMLVMTATGFLLAKALPPVLAACLVFFTPAFFCVSLFDAIRERMDLFSIVAGAGLAPVALWIAPEFDLLLAGLIGGTAAWIAGRIGGRRT